MALRNITLFFLLIFSISLFGQEGIIKGKVISNGSPLPFANVFIEGTTNGVISIEKGIFEIKNLELGQYTVVSSLTGFESQKIQVEISQEKLEIILDIQLKENLYELEEVVISGTRTSKKITDSPVMVNVLNQRTLNSVQACNISDGLKFQPGLRVETDCQTCNYTQLRMNGLGGSYSQILINGRPIFSPLLGLYGLEQIPTNMLERIEVVRGGGSALYGSAAVGGTVNIITKIPTKNGFDFGYTSQLINNKTTDHNVLGNATILNSSKKFGTSIFFNHRNRNWYDHNDDGYSELPKIENTSLGINMFYTPTKNQKLEVSFTNLNEYRYGGEMTNKEPHLALQSEERNHKVYMASADYQININDGNSSVIAYAASQFTYRTHYTGIFPDSSDDIVQHLKVPPYGFSENLTVQGGIQVNHRFKEFWLGPNIITAGAEILHDDVFDEIEAYNYLIDQVSINQGIFLQSDWEISPAINLLAGGRLDKHNFVANPIVSPRLSLMYKPKSTTQYRLTWGKGFRAPQAFDTDMHIAFAGGGVSRISLADNLIQEQSNSITGSVNYDKGNSKFIAGFTLEGFYTQLDNAFYLEALGEDAFGERFEKRNGAGARVYGSTIELRVNYMSKFQAEGGLTLQKSEFKEAVNYIDGLPPEKQFLRTPNLYGYSTLSYVGDNNLEASVNMVYTGSMKIAHFAGAPEQNTDEFKTTNPFTELGFKVGYTYPLKFVKSGIEVFAGIKNITNAYQNDFDTGKNRDSNYIYGTAAPRTFFFGLKVKSL